MTTTFENCTDASTVTIPRADLDAAIEAIDRLISVQRYETSDDCVRLIGLATKLKGLQ